MLVRTEQRRAPMDDSRFDALTRSLTHARSRRGLARLLGGLTLGGPLALGGLAESAAGTKKMKKKRKKKGTAPTATVPPTDQGTVSPPPPPFCSDKPDHPETYCGESEFDPANKSTWYFCQGGVCGLWPDCKPRNTPCAGPSCCSWPTTACDTLGTCGCSSEGLPCTETFDCCGSEQGVTKCVGYVCQLVNG